ncbi:uncharacterized protein LOC131253662 isoform X1 [Magnolia sinica]|uniref:uncharacterized protein LOC131253662 isoform X1 n=1 Tax=Magnolia sinica TaxID=86752 RepID=UPI00265A42D0|nr:uncharacterized protein LOC131253662 isoform X1 [Magnolia sinica]
MAKSSKTVIQNLYRAYFHGIPSKPTSQNAPHPHIFSPNCHHSYPPSFGIPLRNFSSGSSNSRHLSSEIHPNVPSFHKLTSQNAPLPSSIFTPKHHSYTSHIGNLLRNFCSEVSSSGCSNSRHLHGISAKTTSTNAPIPHISIPKHPSCPPAENQRRNCSSGVFPSGFSNSRRFRIGSREFSSRSSGTKFLPFKSPDPGKFDGGFVKTVTDKPLSAIKSTFSRYREAVGLQIEAFWKRNSLVLVGAAGLGICIVLWRVMFGIASTFVGLSEGMAKYGFLALASAIVAFAGLYIRSRFTINPDRIYRIAMRKLNTSAGILEVMGAPLTGTDLRAYVMSGGGLRLKNFKPRLSGKRCFLIFPIRGSERKGLVSVEVKNKKGQNDMKLLAVDIPMATGPDQRLFLIGDEEEYRIGGGLISELRDPIVKAMAAEKEFDDLDQKEEEEDAARELAEAERKRQEEIEKLEKGSP